MSGLTPEQPQCIQAHINSRDEEIKRQMTTIQTQGHELAQLKAYLQQQHATAQAAASSTQPATTAEPPAYLAMLDRLTPGHEKIGCKHHEIPDQRPRPSRSPLRRPAYTRRRSRRQLISPFITPTNGHVLGRSSTIQWPR